MYPMAIFCVVNYTIKEISVHKRFPILVAMIMTHLLMISAVPHKENRFSFTIIGLIFLIIGKTLSDILKIYPRFLRLLL